MKVDLHIHSTASDGKLTPTQIVEKGISLGLHALSITDHDTTASLSEAVKAISSLKVRSGDKSLPMPLFVTGVEMSAGLSGVSVHILGYYIEPDYYLLQEFLLKQQLSREKRARKILNRLAELGINIKWESLQEIAGNSPIGRPHIAQAIADKGYASSVKQAFKKYLDWGAPAYIPREKASPQEVIEVINRAGGIAVLAHPYDLVKKGLNIEEVVSYLKGQGLRGVEVYYGEYNQKQNQNLKEIARRFGLLISGGSDFHGLDPSELPIGEVNIPEEEISPLLRTALKIPVKWSQERF